jgi:hypothetical protein
MFPKLWKTGASHSLAETMMTKTVESKRRHFEGQIEPQIPLIADIEWGNKKNIGPSLS